MPQFRDPNEKRDFMLNTPIPRLVPKMALPSIAGMLVTSAYNLADTLFVSQLGTDATGAVGVNGSIDLIIMMAGSLLAVGAASLTSRLLGAKQDERARGDQCGEPHHHVYDERLSRLRPGLSARGGFLVGREAV